MMRYPRCCEADLRTTVDIDEHLLAEANDIAACGHRTIGSVLEDALRKLIAEQAAAPATESFRLPSFPLGGGLRPGVDLHDKDQVEELLDDGKHHAFQRRQRPRPCHQTRPAP